MPIFSRIRNFARFYLGNSIYLSRLVESVSKETFRLDTSILDPLYAIAIRTKLGFSVATIGKRSFSRMFINYIRKTTTS